MRYIKPFLVIVLVLIADQIFKIWIRNHMYWGEEINVFGNWFILHYTENNGFAFGIELGGKVGKLILTLFRIIAAGFIFYFLLKMIKGDTPTGFNISLSLIFVGAVGNIIDSVFYGVLFDYAPLFHGRVVDMLYFPIIKGVYPDWIPGLGGDYFVFFRPVFNISDTAITTGVLIILFFYKKILKKF
ncbi:lipoprotein signal peptidase [Bacteroidota bacterium]